MNTKFLIGMAGLTFIGIMFNFILFRQDRDEKKSRWFFTSERLLLFVVEILIAVIGFGITLNVTNNNERQIEKENALQMMEQTISYMDKQIKDERDYLRMYNDEELTAKGLLLSSVVNTEYYESILTNELILQNANMNIQGDIMRYLVWIEQKSERAKEAEDEDEMYRQMYSRYGCFIKVRNLLQVSYDQLNGTITEEEVTEKWKEIRSRTDRETIELHEGVAKKE